MHTVYVNPSAVYPDLDDVTEVRGVEPGGYRPKRERMCGQWRLSKPYRTSDGRITAYWARPTVGLYGSPAGSWCGVIIYYAEETQHA